MLRYQKTAFGRDEIHDRERALSRPARNLLLIIDGSRTGAEWLAMVAGASAADLQWLVELGLVAPLAGPAPPAALPVASAPAPAPAPTGAPATAPAAAAPSLEAASFRALYDFLTAQARPRLGLMKGYRAVLDIERCTDVVALRVYALQFVGRVREVQGAAAADEVGRTLSALR